MGGAVGACIWFLIINFVDLYSISDNITGIGVRFVASSVGSFFICYVVMHLPKNSKVCKNLVVVGNKSLEVYFVHCILVRCLNTTKAQIMSSDWLIGIFVDFVFIMLVSMYIIKTITLNDKFYMLVFGTKPLKKTMEEN